METPSSTRTVARSQTLAPPPMKNEESSMQKSAKQDRSALFDITNDSPIVGLAMGSLKTPSSALSKKRESNQGHSTRTPGSGEALLRGQVKTLLEKVEEEAMITLEKRPLFNLISSPINLAAPTPANTPQIFNLDGSVTAPFTETFLLPQMMNGVVDEEKHESLITRSLFLDFSERSDSYQGVGHKFEGSFTITPMEL